MKTTRRLTYLIGGLCLCLSVNGQTLPPVTAETVVDKQLRILKFESAAIARGAIKDRSERELDVFLPASYARDADRRYPVVYAFHGFGDSISELISAVRPLLRNAENLPEFIIVGIDGHNRFGGSFYVNSPLTGNYEDMVVSEVVPLIDNRFRTIPEANGRLLAGFSMGGFAAWNLALAHAGLFAGAWACCPGALDGNGLRDAMPSWDRGFKDAYGAAFAPNNGGDPRPGRTPVFDDSPADQTVQRLWEAGFGGLPEKLAVYRQSGAVLREIRFDYGQYDFYAWIPRGTVATAKALEAAGIKVGIASHADGHEITVTMLREGFLPLVRRLFATQ